MPQNRRDFLKAGALAVAGLPLASLSTRRAHAAPAASSSLPALAEGSAAIRWLEGAPGGHAGAAFGVPWKKGTVPAGTPFSLVTGSGRAVPVQSWPLARWPDGSLKWSGHAIAPNSGLEEHLVMTPGKAPASPALSVRVTDSADSVRIDTGVMVCAIARTGPHLIETLSRGKKVVARDVHLVSLRKASPDTESATERLRSSIERVVVEQDGPVRAVVLIEGRHTGAIGARPWLPFSVRLYFHAGSDAVRVMHAFIHDADENSEFIAGLGLRASVPLPDASHDRHVRFCGEGDGLFAEAVRGLTGLRRDPGAAVRRAQVEGRATPPLSEWAPAASGRLHLIPEWGDYTLAQLSSDGFEIRKRTKEGHAWVKAAAGTRASGLGYLGGPSGGLAFGLRDFWEKYPAQLDIRNAHTEAAEATVWLWSPEAQPMDLRFYHDGMGMDTHPEQIQGLEITYEDYEPGFGTAHGISRSHELVLRAVEATPRREEFPLFAASLRRPPQPAADSAHCHAAGVFGAWSLPDRTHPVKAAIENQMDVLLDTYMKQVAQRRWYGFWDYGDVMHSYDPDRHEWRYDVGGFAWANSELSPDLWLWYAYLRSGRGDVFRLAEAMTRHTGEVDVYHLGRFKGLGTRHNVQHWGCSAKQLRISTVAYRRFHYFLTADERTGDLMRELVDADEAFLTLDPIRKIRKEPVPPPVRAAAHVGFGTDWGSLAYAWLTEWERTGDERLREKLLAGMRTIGEQPLGFLSTGSTFNLDTGEFSVVDHKRISVSHLSAVFGLAELCVELNDLFDVPGFKKAWLQYCELYNAGAEAQRAATGSDFGRLNLWEAHSRLTAYVAHERKDPALAARAWEEFFSGRAGYGVRTDFTSTRIEGPASLNPVEETFGLNTNASSQWGLAAIGMLALVGDSIPASLPSRNRD